MSDRLCLALLGIVFAAIAPAATAQSAPDEYVWWPYAFASGTQTNQTKLPMSTSMHVVNVPGAISIRLTFEDVVLGAEDHIEVTSSLDGSQQKLFPHELAKWTNTSAYFNGDTLVVRLVLSPGSSASFSISDLIVGLGLYPDTICGATDDRILSQDWRAMRATSNPSGSGGGCTIWAASNTNCVLSAGHCTGTFGVAEAEVPLSTSSGGAQHPPADRQWPITNLDFINGGTGNDWAVSTLAPNSLGQLPAQLYGFFPLGFFIPNASDTIRITGYGTVSSPVSATWNVVNKTHSGPATAATGTALHYQTDTTGGNSGSPVINEATGEAVGIHTHGGCSSTGGSNTGTSLTLPSFVNAWNLHCGVPTIPVAGFTSTNPAILQGNSVTFQDTTTGIPSSWAWDLDGDGVTDSTLQHPTFTYNQVGSFTVSLTVTNSLGSDTHAALNYVTVSTLTPATLPVTEDFNAGLPAQGVTGWAFQSDNSFGRIQAGTSGTPSPASGGMALAMDSNTDGNYVTNDAILVVDLVSSNGGVLSYWFMETGDEDDPEDGLWLSDGTNEVLVQPHTGTLSTWVQYTIDLTQAAQTNGLALTNAFRIIWRQRDNFGTPTDGHFVDDIDIQPQNGFFLTFTSTGGDLYANLDNIPAGTSEGWTLISLDTSNPIGSGTLLGLKADLLTLQIIGSPAAAGSLFHWTMPAPPGLYPDVPFILPPGSLSLLAGSSADAQAAALGPGYSFLGASNVAREGL